MSLWCDENGFVVDYPKMLMAALRKIPGAENWNNFELRIIADKIEMVSNRGLYDELPRKKAASLKKTTQEIKKLSDMCDKLADHIESLHNPTVSALSSEGLCVFSLLKELRLAHGTAEITCGVNYASDRSTGRSKKVQAAKVTEITAKTYLDISEKNSTFTTNPETSEITGTWPEVLKLVFDALYIEASITSQVQALSKKSP